MSVANRIHRKTALYRFWQPRYWPLWISLAVLRLIVFLPLSIQLFIGRRLGDLALVTVRKRREIAAANLALCFPKLSDAERIKLLRKHFQSLGMMVIEMGMGGWASDARLNRLVQVEGIEELHRALDQGRGVLLLSAHLVAQELCGRVLIQQIDSLAGLYRINRNPMVDELLRRSRGRTSTYLIPKDRIRMMLRALREGTPVWYAGDQSYRGKGAVLVPFFGEPAMTTSALSQLARISKAPVVPYFTRRLADHSGYRIEILPALDNFPTGDPATDAIRINELLENFIRTCPEQYYWIHRRFKGRPGEYPDPYASRRTER